jgi:hypothetical protein
MNRIHLGILGLVVGLSAGLQAVGCLTINSLNFNSGYVIQLVNNPQSVNPNAALNILTAQVTNNSGTVIPANYQVTLALTEPANPDNCPGAAIISPIGLTIKKALPVGPSVLVATDFAGTVAPTICPLFQDDIQGQFKNINTSNANTAVMTFLRRRFQVTLSDGCSQASTFISIFNPPAANNASPAVPMLPRDQDTVKDPLPLFVWTPAQAGGSTTGVDYILVLSLDESGTPWPGGTIAHIPTGQLFYKWEASDPGLPAGKVYWHVISKDHASGKLIGGQSGQGWGKQFSFTYASSQQAGNCGYSLNDLDQYAHRNAGTKAGLLDGLTLQKAEILSANGGAVPEAALNDPDVCALLGLAGGSAPGKVKLLSLTVTRR